MVTIATKEKADHLPILRYMQNACNLKLREIYLRALTRRQIKLCSQILSGERITLTGSRATQYITRRRVLKGGVKNEKA